MHNVASFSERKVTDASHKAAVTASFREQMANKK